VGLSQKEIKRTGSREERGRARFWKDNHPIELREKRKKIPALTGGGEKLKNRLGAGKKRKKKGGKREYFFLLIPRKKPIPFLFVAVGLRKGRGEEDFERTKTKRGPFVS